MARIRPDQPLVPSVLDRLIDDEPQLSREAPRSRVQLLQDLRRSVRRDLEELLNTRTSWTPLPHDLKELEDSLVNYGIPDFRDFNISSSNERERLRLAVERIIRHNEPRFHTVTVTLLDNVDSMDRTLRFRVDALLYAEPAPEPVAFNSALEPISGNFEVKPASI